MLELAATGGAQRVGGEAVDVAELADGRLVEQGQCVGGKGRRLAVGELQAVVDVLGRVLGPGVLQRDAAVDAAPKGAMDAETEAAPEVG